MITIVIFELGDFFTLRSWADRKVMVWKSVCVENWCAVRLVVTNFSQTVKANKNLFSM